MDAINAETFHFLRTHKQFVKIITTRKIKTI